MMGRVLPATSSDLDQIRSNGQWAQLRLSIHQPQIVLQAQVSGAPSSPDGVAQIGFSAISAGDPANVLPGMTVWVGSAAGDYDLGMCRVRKAPAGGVLPIGETSEIAWANGQHLTVIDEIGLWPRHLRASGDKNFWVDYDESYTDQHLHPSPVVCMGPHLVAELPNDPYLVSVQLSAALSWCLEGGIAAYAWSAADAASITGAATPEATITFDTPGAHRVACTVTGTNGKTATGYRYVLVYDSRIHAHTEIILESCQGSLETGGWSFSVKVYDWASRFLIRDRALCILYADEPDGWPSLPGGWGPKLIAVGWIAGETIEWDAAGDSVVHFSVQGPHWWLNQIEAFPCGFEDTDHADHGGGAPDNWIEFQDLRVDQALWHLLHYRSTATACMDVLLTGDSRQAAALEAPLGSLWAQIIQIAEKSILARPCCDRLGRLTVEIDAQALTLDQRATVTNVMEITPADWMEVLEVERQPVGACGLVELLGVRYSNGAAAPFGARSPGSVFRHFGAPERIEGLVLSGQAQALELAGLLAGWRNNEFPSVSLRLAANNRLIDIAPRQSVTLALGPGDTIRGIDLSGRRLFPRELSFHYDTKLGALLVEGTFEPEAYPLHAVVMSFPGSPGGTEPVPAPPVEPPPPPPPDEPDPPAQPGSLNVLGATSGGVYHTLNLDQPAPTWVKKG